MSLVHDRDADAPLPERVRELDRPGPQAGTGVDARSTAGEVPGAWTTITGAGRRGGHPVTQSWVSRLQAAAGNAAIADLLGPRAGGAGATRRAGPALRHAGDADVPGSDPDTAVPLGTDAPAPLDDPGQAPATPAPTTSFTKVGPPKNTTYTVSGTLRQAAEAVGARPEAGATITTPDMNMGDGWPAQVQVTVDQVVELPEWDGKAAATQNQRNEWDRFKAAITAHENGHVAVDKALFANAHVKIRAKRTRDDATAEFDRIVGQADTDNKTYDGDAHGRPATNINPNIDEVTKVP